MLARPHRAAALVLALVTLAPLGARAEPTTDYVVKDGDTCLGIAIRVLGDRRAYGEIHRLNPELGPLPHLLRPGQVLRLPHRRTDPDARLTGKSGDVRVRRPAEDAWDAARRGMELFRAWRVGAEDRASAEVTFSDTRRLYLREHTIVVIYGPELGTARLATTDAVLERGTLRSRLGELSGPRLRVTTPTAVAGLGAGTALVTVADDGVSTVANHAGAAVDLRGTRGGRVAVASGMGSRVKRGAPPEKPRPLPPAPTWQPGLDTAFAALGADGATVHAAWTGVAQAAWYRLEVTSAGGVVVLAAEVPHTVTQLELRAIPPGAYQVVVAAIDADRFEGRPAPALAVVVHAVAVTEPGAPGGPGTPADPAADPDAPLPLPDLAAAPAAAPRLLAIGAALGDATTVCEANGRDGAPLYLVSAGPTTIVCTTPGGLTMEPFTVEVAAVAATTADGAATVALRRGDRREVRLTLASAVALGEHWRVEPGPGLVVETVTARGGAPAELAIALRVAADAPAASSLTIVDERTGARVATLDVAISRADADAVAPPVAGPAAPPRRRALTVGAYAGWTSFPTGPVEGFELGDPPLLAYQLASGGGGGMRLAYWPRADLFVEADAALVPTGFVAADEPAWVGAGHVVVGLAAVDGPRFGLRGVLGAGGYALFGDHAYARADLDPDITYGVTATLRLRDDLALRLDGRQHIAPDLGDGGVTDVLEATVGIEAVLTRTARRLDVYSPP